MGEGTGIRVVGMLRTLINRALVAVLCLPLAMGCYALWDSHMVYEHANADQWQPYKPTEPEPLSFWELQRINPDVRGWLSVYGTNIEYPVCQSPVDDENKYLTTDAKGDYSLSGALFMEPDASADFSDFATFVYGHHMENGVMFGPLTDFSSKEFFEAHRFGNLFANDRDYGLEFVCYLDVDAYDRDIYRSVSSSADDRAGYVDLLRSRATWWRDNAEVSASDRLLMLSTCTTGGTNARAILVGKMGDQTFENPFVKIPNLGTGVDEQRGMLGIPWWCWLVLGLFALVVTALIVAGRKKTHERPQGS